MKGTDLLWNVGLTYEQARKGRKTVKIGDLRLFLVSVEDLIKMKKKAAREQDLADIDALRKLRAVGKPAKRRPPK